MEMNMEHYPQIKRMVRIRQNFADWIVYKASRYVRHRINNITLAVLRLCDGTKRTREICSIMANEGTVSKDTLSLLDYLQKEDIIELNPELDFRKPPIYEDKGPAWVVIHVTNQCNLRCAHCYVDAHPCNVDVSLNIADELSTEELFCFIEDLRKIGVVDVIFTGGEPLVRSDIIEVLKFVKHQDMGTELLTNAVLIDERLAELIVEADVGNIFVSLDGSTAKTHEKLRKVKGCFEKTITGIRNLREKGKRVIINTTVNQQNLDDLQNMPPLLEKLGAEMWRMGFIFHTGRAKRENRAFSKVFDVSIEQCLEKTALLDSRYLKEKWPFSLVTTFNWASILDTESKLPRVTHICGVNIGKYLYVRANGEVLVCDRIPDLIIGNIRTNSLDEIWANNLLREWRYKSVNDIPGCKECKWKFLCGSGCRANAMWHKGEYFVPDPIACLMTEDILKRLRVMPREIRERVMGVVEGN